MSKGEKTALKKICENLAVDKTKSAYVIYEWPQRTNSCPDCHEIEEIVAAKNKPIIEDSKPKDSTEEKTDDKFRGINDEEPNIAENSEIFSIIL